MATTSACAVGSFVAVTRFAPSAMMRPSFARAYVLEGQRDRAAHEFGRHGWVNPESSLPCAAENRNAMREPLAVSVTEPELWQRKVQTRRIRADLARNLIGGRM